MIVLRRYTTKLIPVLLIRDATVGNSAGTPFPLALAATVASARGC